MSPTDVRGQVLALLSRIAPEADLARLPADASLRDELDIDSIDQLNFAIALGREFDIEIPQNDLPRLGTVEGCVHYIERVIADRAAWGASPAAETEPHAEGAGRVPRPRG